MVSSMVSLYRTHSDDNMLCICSTVVVEQFIVGTDLRVHFVHVHPVRLPEEHHSRGCMPLLPGRRYPGSERNLSGTDGSGSVHVCGTHATASISSHVFQIFIIPRLDLLDLVRSTETIEEVDERNFTFDSRQMSYRSQVHNFLYAGFSTALRSRSDGMRKRRNDRRRWTVRGLPVHVQIR